MQVNPFLQASDGTEGLGVDLAKNVHPIDGGALQYAVNAQTLMSFAVCILYFFPEPQNSFFFSVFIVLDFDEAALASGNLKLFDDVHTLSIGVFLLERRPIEYFYD